MSFLTSAVVEGGAIARSIGSSNQSANTVSPSSLLPLPKSIEFTDISGGMNTNAVLNMNTSASGFLNSGDHDWFKVHLDKGQTYSFAVIGTKLNSLNDPVLKLIDPDG